MPPKEHDQASRISHETEPHEMAHKQRVSSSSSQSRLAIKAAAMAQMNALELASTKAEMERLREENRSLRGIIKQLESLEVVEDCDDNDIRSEYGNLEGDANVGPGYSISISSSPSLQSDESSATILRNPSSGNFETITYSSPERVLERPDYDQTESEAIQLAKAIFDGNTTDCNSDPEFPRNSWQSQSGTARPPSRPRALYEIPDGFDPDNEDYNLSDVETVTSDQALEAWGIGEQPVDIGEIGIPSADEGDIYETVDEQDEDNEEGWEAINEHRRGTSVAGPGYFLEPVLLVSSEPEDPEDDAVDRGQDSDAEGDDSSTVLGEPRSTSPTSIVEDDEASTVAETGSVGIEDERWRALMRDLGEEEQEGGFATADMEKTRSEAEQNEKAARDQEYKHAISQNEEISANITRAGHARNLPDGVSEILSEETLRPNNTTTLSEEKNTVLGDCHPPVRNERPQDIKIASANQTGGNDVSQDLVGQFRDAWKALTPGLPPGPTNSGSGRHSTVGWINIKPVTEDGNDKPANKLHDNPSQIKEKDEASGGNRMSESDRILQSFDPREDVIGILRPKAKGEKNTLNDEIVDTKQPKKVKAAQRKEQQVVNMEPTRAVGKVENQFRLLKEERLQREAADEKLWSATGQRNETTLLEARILGEPTQTRDTSTDDKLLAQPLTPHTGILTNEAPKLGPADNLNWTARTGRKSQFTPFSVKTGDLLNDPDLIMQEPLVTNEIPESVGVFRTETPPKKSLRFQGVSPPYGNAVKMLFPTPQPSPAPIVKGLPPLRPLISILKNDTPQTPLSAEPKKSYNHEYVREVVIRNLPKDIAYSSLLDQVSGGLLEKVVIDWNVLEARIVFTEPEAARRFYTKIGQNGFWVHTELPHTRLVGKENLIQCTLGGFLWTQNSSSMTPAMIDGIWNRRASRCLLFNDFPRNISTKKLMEDIYKLFLGSPVQERDIIERVGIKRNLQVSSTGLMACVGFTAIMFAVKVGKELRRMAPVYSEITPIYDADPCGGLGGTGPPSVWDLGKGVENVKPEVKKSVSQAMQPQTNTAIRKPVTQRPIGVQRGQPSAFKTGKNSGASGKAPFSQSQRQMRPPPANQAPGFIGLGKTFADAVGVTQRTAARPVREYTSLVPPPVRQRFPTVSPNLQQGLPPQNISYRYNYDNWDAEPEVEIPRPEGAHWNHKEQNLVQEYQQALVKKRRRGSDADKVLMVGGKVEKPKPETSYYDRLVYLTNLPRDVNVTRLLRVVRGGAVEHLILQPPSSQYDTCKAVIIFIHRSSARDYKSYLQSPGLVITRGHRVAYMEDVNDRRFDGIRLVPAPTIRSDGLTRCLKADKLPRGTTLSEVLGVIEEGMNHSTLEFENAIIDTSQEDRDMVVVILRLVSVGRAVWAAGMLRKRYDGMILSYDRDPCQGPLTELEEVNLREEAD